MGKLSFLFRPEPFHPLTHVNPRHKNGPRIKKHIDDIEYVFHRSTSPTGPVLPSTSTGPLTGWSILGTGRNPLLPTHADGRDNGSIPVGRVGVLFPPADIGREFSDAFWRLAERCSIP